MSDLESEYTRWQDATLKQAIEHSPQRAADFTTESGIPVKALYTPLDVAGSDYRSDLSFPGEFPYTRGVYPSMYRGQLWTMRQYAGFGYAEETNRRFRYLLEQGGTILHARGAVVGLTSAATIWVVAAIGVALGSGHYLEGTGATLFVVAVLRGLGRAEKRIARHTTHTRVTVHARPDPSPLEELETVVGRTGLEIVQVAQRRENVNLVIEYEFVGPKRLHDQLMIALMHHPAVRTVSRGE